MRKRAAPLLLSLTFVMLGAGAAMAVPLTRPAPGVGTIVSAQGGAELAPVERPDWLLAEAEQDLLAGDGLRTGRLGGLSVLFADQTQIRIGRNAILTVQAVAGAAPAGGDTLLDLLRGRLWARGARGGQGIQVRTPAATAAIRGTDWSLTVEEDGRTTLIVLAGEVTLANEFGAVSVGPGEIATAIVGRPPTKTFLVNPESRPQLILHADLGQAWRYFPPVEGGPGAVAPGSVEALLDSAERAITEDRWADARAARDAAAARIAPEGPLAGRLAFLDGYFAAHARDPALAARRFRAAAEALPPPRRTTALVQAYLALLQGRDVAAAQALEAHLPPADQDPRSARIRLATLIFASALEDAARFGAQAAARWPEDATLRLLHVLALELLGREAEVRAQGEALARDLPDEPRAWLAYGHALADIVGDQEAAALAFERGLALAPNDSDLLNEYGLALYALDETRRAEAAFRRALVIDPGSVPPRANLAILLLDTYRLDEAEAEVARVRGQDPGFASGLLAEGRLAFQRGDIETARRLFLEASTADPLLADAVLATGLAAYAGGDLPATDQAIDDALRTDANDPNAAIAGSVIARDRAMADRSILFAREAVRRIERGGGAGQELLTTSRGGQTNLGSAFTFLGLEDWGRYYGDRLGSDLDSTTLLFRAVNTTDPETVFSSLLQGLMLDPLASSGRLRYTDLLRRPFIDLELGARAGLERDESIYGGDFDLEAFTNAPLPTSIAIVGDRTLAQRQDQPGDNNASNLLALVGTELTPFDRLSLVGTFTDQTLGVPGTGLPRPDDRSTADTGAISLGYSHSFGARDLLLARAYAFRNRAEDRLEDPFIEVRGTQRNKGAGLQLRRAVEFGSLTLSGGVEGAAVRQGSESRLEIDLFDFRLGEVQTETSQVLSGHVDLTWQVTGRLQFEAGLFPVQRFQDSEAEDLHWGPRLGVAWQPLAGHWLRLAYREETAGTGFGSLAPATTLGLARGAGPLEAGARDRGLIARWDAEWSPRFFTSLEAAQHRLHDLEIELPETFDTLLVENATVSSLRLAANAWLGHGLGAFAVGTLRDSEVEDGPYEDQSIPSLADRELRLGLVWVHPSQVRVTASQLLAGGRRSFDPAGGHLGAIASTDIAVTWEPLDKRLELGLSLSNLFDNRNRLADDVEGPGRTILATARVRF